MSGGGSGANSYWPGFVDALTNVVIAMIFVVVVLAISLSFAAQMMGKKLAEKYIQEHQAKAAQAAPAAPPPLAAPLPESALRNITRIAVAGNEAAASAPAGGTVRQVRNTLLLDYAPQALTLDPAAAERFKAAVAALGSDLAQRRVQVVAGGPAMALSDNQRAAYLRVMAVRNQLLELGVAPAQIDVRIETEVDAPAARVNVSFSDKP
jgi:hypothetical protein